MAHGRTNELRSVGLAVDDAAFFADHRDRMFRIRQPLAGEFESEFRSLGDHDASRRRVIVARAFGPLAKLHGVKFMPAGMLLFADETVEDRDDVLMPIYNEIMHMQR